MFTVPPVTEAPHIILNGFVFCRIFTANIVELTLWSCEAGGQYFSTVISSVMLKFSSLTAVLHVTSAFSISDDCSFVLFVFSSKSGIAVCAMISEAKFCCLIFCSVLFVAFTPAFQFLSFSFQE